MPCHIDHLTITAPTLEIGRTFIQHTLGVEPQQGGMHPRMGTHNLLLHLGEKLFLEIIAVDPSATPPTRPRWFNLDHPTTTNQPRLVTWVVRTDHITQTAATSTEALGNIEPMSRGPLNWNITIPSDGSLPLNGIAPTLIEWEAHASHPANQLKDQGLSLQSLELHHPEPERVSKLLSSIGCCDTVSVMATDSNQSPFLIAHINTPNGLRILG